MFNFVIGYLDSILYFNLYYLIIYVLMSIFSRYLWIFLKIKRNIWRIVDFILVYKEFMRIFIMMYFDYY